MRRRVLGGALQIATFVGGGVICPAVHMAWHRADHSHGPGGVAMAFDVAAPLPTAPGDTPRHPTARGPGAQRAHAHPHPAPPVTSRVPAPPSGTHQHPHHGRTHSHSHAAEPTATPESPRPGPSSSPAARATPPAHPWHGHGSLAHFGLALLSAPPPLALPAPEPAGELASTARPRLVALHRPVFPLPRPPPARASS